VLMQMIALDRRRAGRMIARTAVAVIELGVSSDESAFKRRPRAAWTATSTCCCTISVSRPRKKKAPSIQSWILMRRSRSDFRFSTIHTLKPNTCNVTRLGERS
jgi:hypothetical protein